MESMQTNFKMNIAQIHLKRTKMRISPNLRLGFNIMSADVNLIFNKKKRWTRWPPEDVPF